jgi:hypothetical protein
MSWQLVFFSVCWGLCNLWEMGNNPLSPARVTVETHSQIFTLPLWLNSTVRVLHILLSYSTLLKKPPHDFNWFRNWSPLKCLYSEYSLKVETFGDKQGWPIHLSGILQRHFANLQIHQYTINKRGTTNQIMKHQMTSMRRNCFWNTKWPSP